MSPIQARLLSEHVCFEVGTKRLNSANSSMLSLQENWKVIRRTVSRLSSLCPSARPEVPNYQSGYSKQLGISCPVPPTPLQSWVSQCSAASSLRLSWHFHGPSSATSQERATSPHPGPPSPMAQASLHSQFWTPSEPRWSWSRQVPLSCPVKCPCHFWIGAGVGPGMCRHMWDGVGV